MYKFVSHRKSVLERAVVSLFFVFVAFSSCTNVTETIYRNVFTVTFDANGGTGKMGSQTFVQGKEQALSKNAFNGPNGRVFAGWATEQGSGVKVYDDNQYIKITENLCLYALWKMNEGSGTATESKEWIFDSWMDTSVRPGDNFYKYGEGGWAKNPNEVGTWHKNHSSDDTGTLDNQEVFCNEFIDKLFDKNSTESKKFKLFKKAAELYPVTESQKQAEIEALKKELQRFDALTTAQEVMEEFAEAIFFNQLLFGLYSGHTTRVDSDCFISLTSEWNWMLEENLTLKTIAGDDEKILEKYKEVLAIDDSNEQDYIESLLNFIKALSNKNNTVDEKNRIMEDILSACFTKKGITASYKNNGKDYFRRLNLIGSDGIDGLSLENAKMLIKHSYALKSLRTILYPEKTRESGVFSYAYVKAFKDIYDPDGSRRAYVKNICDELKSKFEERLLNNTWMSENTKQNALKKLRAMNFYCGYLDDFPQEWLMEKDYEAYTSYYLFYRKLYEQKEVVCTNRSMDESLSLEERLFEVILQNYSPICANATFIYVFNSVFIPVSNLGGVVFNPEYPDAYNYGFLGFIIGHELCHGFDATGSKYDENGITRDWWCVSDKLRYEDKIYQMVQLYDMFTLDSNSFLNVDGFQTLEENMADLGGYTTIYDVFVSKKLKEGFSGENLIRQKKMFFQTLPITLSNTGDDDFFENYIKTNTHSPFPLRVNGLVSLMDDWYDLYDVQPGDRYYLEPSQRVILW